MDVAAVSQRPVSQGETPARDDGRQGVSLALAFRGIGQGPLSGVGKGTFRPEADRPEVDALPNVIEPDAESANASKDPGLQSKRNVIVFIDAGSRHAGLRGR